MSETKHTPGPWRNYVLPFSKEQGDYLVDNHMRIIAEFKPHKDLSDAEKAANKVVIIAAPELLAALKKMLLFYWEGYEDPIQAARTYAAGKPNSATATALKVLEPFL